MDKLIIGYIENGIVIDHLPHGSVWEVSKLLKLGSYTSGRVSLGDGYESSKTSDGKKGILKIEGRGLNEEELNLIALIASDASYSVIKNGKVMDKRTVSIPECLEGLVDCPNNNCVSNIPISNEKLVPIINYQKGVFSCHYCRYKFDKSELKLRI